MGGVGMLSRRGFLKAAATITGAVLGLKGTADAMQIGIGRGSFHIIDNSSIMVEYSAGGLIRGRRKAVERFMEPRCGSDGGYLVPREHSDAILRMVKDKSIPAHTDFASFLLAARKG